MIEMSVFDLGIVGCLGFMMMMKSGFVQYLAIQIRKKLSRTSTSSSSRGWCWEILRFPPNNIEY